MTKRKQLAPRDPLAFLLDVMQGLIVPTPLQLRAAIAAVKYVRRPRAADDEAPPAPRLVIDNER